MSNSKQEASATQTYRWDGKVLTQAEMLDMKCRGGLVEQARFVISQKAGDPPHTLRDRLNPIAEFRSMQVEQKQADLAAARAAAAAYDPFYRYREEATQRQQSMA